LVPSAPQALCLLVALVLVLVACRAGEPVPVASEAVQGPIRLALPAGTRPELVIAHGTPLAARVARDSGLRVMLSVPTSLDTAVDALGTGNVDAAWLSPFAYVVAHDRWAADALLGTTVGGSGEQTGQIVLPTASGRLSGRRVTGIIPRDALAVRASLPGATRDALRTSLLRVALGDEGRGFLSALFVADGLVARADADFDRFRAMLRTLDIGAEQLMGPRSWQPE